MKTYQEDIRLIDEDGYAIVDKYEALNYTDIFELYAMAYVLKCKDVLVHFILFLNLSSLGSVDM